MPTPRSRAAILLAVLLAASVPLVATGAETDLCDGFTFVPYQGPSCPVPGGWRVLLDDGTSMLTHGPDYAASQPAPAAGAYPSFPPTCAAGGEHHVRAIYAHPSDAPDRSAAMMATLRDQINRSNGQIYSQARALGDDITLRLRCNSDGLVDFAIERLSFPHAQASFSNISQQLRARGHHAHNAKYLVFYDANNGGGIGGGIAGQATVHMDDRLSPNNANLGGGDYAINYGYTGVFGAEVTLHEMSHNQGAVQLTAPHSSGGWHCNDGRDTMCYADGGANASYTSSRCAVTTYDCGADTYFHPSPAAGSYLATHWNLASRYNKFLAFGPRENVPPTITSFSCGKASTRAGETTSCSVYVYDADEDPAFGGADRPIDITIDWGDGTTSGPLEAQSGEGASASKAWSANGTYVLRASAVDRGAPPKASETATHAHVVECSYRRSSSLLVGLGGLATIGTAHVFEVPCADQPYRLLGNAPNDFDVCWLEGTVLLRCDENPGDEAGHVPAGATHARVVLRFGFNGAYNLFVDAA